MLKTSSYRRTFHPACRHAFHLTCRHRRRILRPARYCYRHALRLTCRRKKSQLLITF